ncbi:MAG: IgA Peptidase M64 [Paramuribaculum sp.]|nr:IgA Peptidase M64 [Paramuribaculum sp.]
MRLFSIIAAMVTLSASAATDFNKHFTDSTLRVDYMLGGKADNVAVTLYGQSKYAGWAGRRHSLDKLPYIGNGQVTVVDAESGDTIYRNSFSTLFQEWLATEEAQTTPRAMEHTVLVPLPAKPATVILTLLDSRHNVIAETCHLYRPDDELIAVRPADTKAVCRWLHKGGDSTNAIDVAILAEGYTSEEMDSFFIHAQTAVDEILSYAPFSNHRDDFNFIAVATPSAHSGVSVPRLKNWKNTAFSSHFSTFYSDRYLTTDKVFTINDALQGIPCEHIIILANTEEYGGGGIYNSYTLTAARHPMFRPVVVHEFGHSFGGLADEYFYTGDVMEDTYPQDVEPWEPNITTLRDFDSKWKSLLKPGTPVPTSVDEADKYPVGVFEGGGYSFKGVYRPADECRMRNNTYPTFCSACIDALDRLIRFYTGK